MPVSSDKKATQLATIASDLVAWYRVAKRALPWRATRDPYAIWISEVMSQQTRVAVVIPYWTRWLQRFPTVASLADAPADDVLSLWSGLGYYSRARNLHAGAKAVVDRFGGELPRNANDLVTLPGVGRYTAGAIASISFGERAALVDGNVARVFARVFGISLSIKSPAGQKILWRYAEELHAASPRENDAGDLNQAVMELGATVCTPRSPSCERCPLAKVCEAKRTDQCDRLPMMAKPKSARELPLLSQTALWLTEGDSLLVAKRVNSGLFAGMWELPAAATMETLLAEWGVPRASEPVAFHQQVLSHRRLEIDVVCGLGKKRETSYSPVSSKQYQRWQFVPFAKLKQLGIAAATAAIVAKYQDSPWNQIAKPLTTSPKVSKTSSRASKRLATTPKTQTSSKPQREQRKASMNSSMTKPKSKAKSMRS